MTIRPMAAADLDAVISLAASIPEVPHWSRSAWEAYLSDSAPPRRIFVAESGGKLIAFLAAHIIKEACELESIAVVATHRRSGVATALLHALIVWAGQHGASKVQLEVRSASHSAVAFYSWSGFRRDGLRPRYYQDPPDDALLMTLLLEPPTQP